MAKTTSLFKYVLGNRFEELPAPLRGMLAGPETRWYRGTASVTRGSNLLSHLVGSLMGLPRKAHEIDVSLEVVPGVHRETWVRHFGRRKLRTAMRPGGRAGRGRIVERVGAVTLTLELTVEGGELVYRTLSARFLGIPLPRGLAPSVEAVAAEEDGRLRIESTTNAGGIGRLLRYRLSLEPEPVSAAEIAALNAPPAPAPAEPAPAAEANPDATVVQPKAPASPPTADTGEETLVARPAPNTGPDAVPASQRTPHPAEPTAETIPIDTEHARPGRKRSGSPPHEDPRSEADKPHPAASGQATIPVSPSRRRRAPKTGD